MSTPDAAREPLLRDESPRARATGPPLWLSLLVALAFAAFAAVVAAGVGMRAANPAEALVDPTAANPADALVDPTATTASEGALDASHRPALASRVRPHRHGHVRAFLGRDDRDDHDHHRRRRRRPDASSEEAPVSSEVSLPISDPAIPTPTTVDLPGRDIHMRRAPAESAFCATRARTNDGDWRGRRAAVFGESTLSFRWPDPDDVVAARRACRTPHLRALQDSGEFADAFCFLLRPSADGSDHGGVAFDVDPVCASEYNFQRHVVPAAPAFLEWVAARLTCEVTTVVRMRDAREDDPPLTAASRQSLEANATYPLVREGTVASKSGMPNMPDFTFLRTRGFRERAFGDVVLEDTRGDVGGEVEKTADDVGNAVENAVGNAGNALPASSSSLHASSSSAETARVRAAWRAKRRAVFWRGPNAGHGPCEWTDRARLARDFFDARGLDARVVVEEEISYADASTRRCAGPRAATDAGLAGGFAVSRAPPVSAWTRSRGVVVVAGVGPDPARFLRLASDSVVMSLTSPTSDVSDFLDDRAVPWVHYVPATFDTLRDRVAWIMDDANEEAQVRMIVEAHKLVESITWEREAERLGDALNEAACGTKRKEETKEMKERTKRKEETKMNQRTKKMAGTRKASPKMNQRTKKMAGTRKASPSSRKASPSSRKRETSSRLGAANAWFVV